MLLNCKKVPNFTEAKKKPIYNLQIWFHHNSEKLTALSPEHVPQIKELYLASFSQQFLNSYSSPKPPPTSNSSSHNSSSQHNPFHHGALPSTGLTKQLIIQRPAFQRSHILPCASLLTPASPSYTLHSSFHLPCVFISICLLPQLEIFIILSLIIFMWPPLELERSLLVQGLCLLPQRVK